MSFQSLRITGAQVYSVPPELNKPLVLQKQDFGFLVLPLTNGVYAFTQQNGCKELPCGDILIIPGVTPGCIFSSSDPKIRKVPSDISAKNQHVRELFSQNSSKLSTNDGWNQAPAAWPADNPHYYTVAEADAQSSADQQEPVAVVLAIELCEIVKGGIGKTLPDSLHFAPGINLRNYILGIANQLAQLPRTNEDINTARVNRLTELLLLEAIDFYLRKNPLGSRLVKGVSDRGISKALRAVHVNPENNWSLSELANIANMSRSHFADKFKRTLNETPFNYIRQCRIQRAKILLCETHASMEQIAQECGYASQSSFIKTFASITGTSPGEWRVQKNAAAH